MRILPDSANTGTSTGCSPDGRNYDVTVATYWCRLYIYNYHYIPSINWLCSISLRRFGDVCCCSIQCLKRINNGSPRLKYMSLKSQVSNNFKAGRRSLGQEYQRNQQVTLIHLVHPTFVWGATCFSKVLAVPEPRNFKVPRSRAESEWHCLAARPFFIRAMMRPDFYGLLEPPGASFPS